jgi:hypothetical protein
MSTDHETTRIVRTWLQEGATTVPDRVLDEVFDQLPTTRQRRFTRSGRGPSRVSDRLRVPAALAAAVVIALVVLGPLAGSFGPPTATPSPTPMPTVHLRPSPTPPPVPEVSLVPGVIPAIDLSPPPLAADVLEPGTYDVLPAGANPMAPGSIEFTVPAGWSGWAMGVEAVGALREDDSAPRGMAISFWTVQNVFSDPCRQTLMRPPPGPETTALALALSSINGTDATAPRRVTIGAFHAEYTEFRITTDYPADCNGLFYLWMVGPDQYRWAHGPGELDRNWVFDLAGTRVLMTATSQASATAGDLAELQAIVDSVRITRN